MKLPCAIFSALIDPDRAGTFPVGLVPEVSDVPIVPLVRSPSFVLGVPDKRPFQVQGSKFGSNNRIWLKARRNSLVFFHTLIPDLWLVRVHEFVAREISVLQRENLPLWTSTPSVQQLQTHIESPQKKARPQTLAGAPWSFGSGKRSEGIYDRTSRAL